MATNGNIMTVMCRFCLQDGPDLEPITNSTFDCADKSSPSDQDLVQLILRYLSIQIVKQESSTDALICQPCRTVIEKWHIFYETCLRNDEIYQQQMNSIENSKLSSRNTESPKIKREHRLRNKAPSPANDSDSLPHIGEVEYSSDSTCSSSIYDEHFAKNTPKSKTSTTIPLKKRRKTRHEDVESNSNLKTCATETAKFSDSESEAESSTDEITEKRNSRKRGRPKNEIKSEKRADVCTICGKFIKNMSEHMRIHNNERRHQCPYCPKAFVSASNYNSHVNIHTRAKMYKCDLCDKQYSLLNSLKQHRFTHFKERVHLCPICGKSYYQSTGLARHKRTHFEEPKIKCSECDKMFLTNADLRKHFTKHLDQKPFSCEVCNRAFSRKDNLRTHMKTHRGNTSQTQRIDASEPSTQNPVKQDSPPKELSLVAV